MAMFKFTVIMPITAKVETVLRLLGTYKIILKRKNHRNTMVQFYYIRANFLVLRGPEVFLSWYLVKCTLCPGITINDTYRNVGIDGKSDQTAASRGRQA